MSNNNNRISITRAHANANQLIQQAKNNGTYAAKKAENNAMIRNSARRAFSKNNVYPHALGIRAHTNANQLIQQAKNNGTYAAKKAKNNAMIRNSARRAFSKNNVYPLAQIKLNSRKGKKKYNSTTLKKRANKAARNVNNLKMGGRRKRKTRRHKKHKRKTHKRKRRTHKRNHRRLRRRTRRS
jgi:hypothetical protein